MYYDVASTHSSLNLTAVSMFHLHLALSVFTHFAMMYILHHNFKQGEEKPLAYSYC